MQIAPAPTLTLHLPSTRKRFSAMFLDGLILIPPYVLLMWLMGTKIENGMVFFPWVPYIGCAILIFMYNALFLKFWSATPGKRLLGFYVTDAKTLQPNLSWKQALSRPIVDGIFTIFLSFIPRVVALFRLDRRQLADLVAGTQVMQEKARPKPIKRRWILGSLLMVYFGLITASTWVSFSRDYSFDSRGIYANLNPRKTAE